MFQSWAKSYFKVGQLQQPFISKLDKHYFKVGQKQLFQSGAKLFQSGAKCYFKVVHNTPCITWELFLATYLIPFSIHFTAVLKLLDHKKWLVPYVDSYYKSYNISIAISGIEIYI